MYNKIGKIGKQTQYSEDTCVRFFSIEYKDHETNSWTPFCTTRFDHEYDAWRIISKVPSNREFRVIELGILGVSTTKLPR